MRHKKKKREKKGTKYKPIVPSLAGLRPVRLTNLQERDGNRGRMMVSTRHRIGTSASPRSSRVLPCGGALASPAAYRTARRASPPSMAPWGGLSGRVSGWLSGRRPAGSSWPSPLRPLAARIPGLSASRTQASEVEMSDHECPSASGLSPACLRGLRSGGPERQKTGVALGLTAGCSTDSRPLRPPHRRYTFSSQRRCSTTAEDRRATSTRCPSAHRDFFFRGLPLLLQGRGSSSPVRTSSPPSALS